MQSISNYIKNRQHYLLLLLIIAVVYWPLTFHVFSLKNDSLVYFLPYRLHISESIQQGYFPWWNPYLYTGLPLHSDIQSGVWNPVVMLISLFTTYNMSVLQWELLFYLLVAATGMYKLVKSLGCRNSSAMAAAVVYTCSGFMTDSGGLLPWITSAAYLPFVIYYFLQILQTPTGSVSIKLAFALALLLTSGYPSYFIFTAYVLFAGLICWIVTHREKKQLGQLAKYLSLAILLFLLVCSPAILSWWDYLHYYERGKGTSIEMAGSNSFPLFSSISFLLSTTVSKSHEWLATDISARNSSIGLVFFILFLYAVTGKLKPLQKFILAITLFAFLFSLGPVTPIREWCYRILPLMNTFRHPASIRIFTIMGMILLAAPVLDQLATQTAGTKKRLNIIILITGLTLLGFFLYYFGLFRQPDSPGEKSFLNKLAFGATASGLALVQLLFLIVFFWLVKRGKPVIPLVVFNAVLLCSFAFPFTFLSKARTPEVNEFVARFPKGIITPDIHQPVYTTHPIDSTGVGKLGYHHFYKKTISIQDHVITPTLSKNYRDFLSDSSLRKKLAERPFAYFDDPNNQVIKLTGFTPNRFELKIHSVSADSLHLFQVYHDRWRVVADGQSIMPVKSNRAFIAVAVPAGTQQVSFIFTPWQWVRASLYISLLAIIGCLAFLLFPLIKNRRPS